MTEPRPYRARGALLTAADLDAATNSSIATARDYSAAHTTAAFIVAPDGSVRVPIRADRADRPRHHAPECLTPPANPVPATRDPKPRRAASAGAARAIARDSELHARRAADRERALRADADDMLVALAIAEYMAARS